MNIMFAKLKICFKMKGCITKATVLPEVTQSNSNNSSLWFYRKLSHADF